MVARVDPATAIEMVLEAYREAGGYPDIAALKLGYTCRDSLHRLNRKLGIKRHVRAATGHYPGCGDHFRGISRMGGLTREQRAKRAAS